MVVVSGRGIGKRCKTTFSIFCTGPTSRPHLYDRVSFTPETGRAHNTSYLPKNSLNFVPLFLTLTNGLGACPCTR